MRRNIHKKTLFLIPKYNMLYTKNNILLKHRLINVSTFLFIILVLYCSSLNKKSD